MPVHVAFHHRSRRRGGQDVSSVDLNNKCDRALSDASSAYTRIRYIVANNCGVASVTKNTRPRALRMKYERRLNKIWAKEGSPKTSLAAMCIVGAHSKREHYNF